MLTRTTQSIFGSYQSRAYPYRYAGEIFLESIAGGTPKDPTVIEGWLRTKLADKEDLIREEVAHVMVDMGLSRDDAVSHLENTKHLNGFRSDENGLFLLGMQLKACLKESANIRWPARQWTVGKKLKAATSKTEASSSDVKKATRSWFPEHVFVVEDRLYFGCTGADEVFLGFPRNWRGDTSIQLAEVLREARLSFTVETDYEFSDEDWAMLWTTAERNGLGACRSQGFGRFAVTRWDQII